MVRHDAINCRGRRLLMRNAAAAVLLAVCLAIAGTVGPSRVGVLLRVVRGKQAQPRPHRIRPGIQDISQQRSLG